VKEFLGDFYAVVIIQNISYVDFRGKMQWSYFMYILLVDDEPDILVTISEQLETQGWIVDCAETGHRALNLSEQQEYDVVILDIMMPGGDGLSTCKQLRNRGCTCPILFLTAFDTVEDKIKGFDAGGDDYLVKPFHMSELLCRVKALAKRISRNQLSKLSVGELEIDLDSRLVKRQGQVISLGLIQFNMLKEMMLQAPKAIEREKLEQKLWGEDVPDSDALKSHLYQLRSLVDKPFAYPMIQTVRGQGYRVSDVENGI